MDQIHGQLDGSAGMIFKKILESFWALVKHPLLGVYGQWFQGKIFRGGLAQNFINCKI